MKFLWNLRRISDKISKCFDKTKLVIKKFKQRQVYAKFKGNIWTADLGEMRPLSFFSRNVKYSLYVIDVFTKYASLKHLKRKKKINIF